MRCKTNGFVLISLKPEFTLILKTNLEDDNKQIMNNDDNNTDNE